MTSGLEHESQSQHMAAIDTFGLCLLVPVLNASMDLVSV